ncbi:rhodanese-like domain-containing protein [Streptomyces sp. TRM70350]|uniref:rhodanese-like domain-containing protein n=1 Tax=Streptomyces sp. TRM70350 TaxID=2856165 RepID=UPI001C443978|nr:rhodanese-like domain-containing protein [Streptomyces sp. TRM70350]MBV7694641.1 rhodanese-like domain-containing protein [Streptomyces sp. TRM70350]
MTAPVALSPEEARTRLPHLSVVDVRTPAEYAAGHLPGALNIPLDQLHRALPALREARGDLLVVCASGRRSEQACVALAEEGVPAMTLAGGTQEWARRGHELGRPHQTPRTTWSMERQVRLTAGALVLTGLALGLLHPVWQLLAAGIAGGLVFSALTDTCGLAALLGRLPYNRPRPADLAATLAALRAR